MCFYGGQSIRPPTQIFRGWLSTIFQFPVCIHLEIDRHADTCFATATSTSGFLAKVDSSCHIYASIRALMCLGSWIQLGLVKDADIYAVTALAEV